MARPASYPLPLVAGSRRPSLLRCEACFHIGAAVRVSGTLLCGDCFLDASMSEEAKRADHDEERQGAALAYDQSA
jgi:hypothetical protein